MQNIVEIEDAISTIVEIATEAPSAIEVFEGGVVVTVDNTSSIDATLISLAPPIGGITNVQTILQRLFDGFIHTQSTPQLVWNIAHNLGWLPTYTLTDLAGNPINAAVSVTTTNATVTGVVPFTGKLNLR